MSATTVMAVAIVGGIVGRWAHNRPAVPSATSVLKVMFGVVVIAALDQGATQSIAQGFAWLFLAAVLLADASPLTGIASAINAKGKK